MKMLDFFKRVIYENVEIFFIFTHAYGGGGRSAELEGGFSAPLEKKSKFSINGSWTSMKCLF